MLKPVALALCLLAVGTKAIEGHQTFGVKLCGREFIRAVIFTCGGSRWRRADRDADLSLNRIDSIPSDELPEDPFLLPDGEVSDNWGPHQQLEVESHPGLAGEPHDGAGFKRVTRALITEEVMEALRTSGRKGRDVVVGLSNACCKWGCSKSEISSLC